MGTGTALMEVSVDPKVSFSYETLGPGASIVPYMAILGQNTRAKALRTYPSTHIGPPQA
jgi:hypothetical protein